MKGSPNNSIWYRSWKWYLMRCLELFYRRIEATGTEDIPRDKAVIFASNHTNALMDPLVITYRSGRQHYFMTRGDVFEKKILEKIFRSWRMLPIFRMKDGIKSLARNEEIMRFVIDQLKDQHSIIIFPEGTHYWTRTVHPLKKGLVRMAFDVLEEKPDTDLVVVPVGLYFNDLIHVNQDVLVSFGKPISVADFPQDENQAKTYQNFNKTLRDEMRKLVIDMEIDDHYDQKEHWRIELEKKLQHLSVQKSFAIQQRFVIGLEQVANESPENLKAANLNALLEHPAFNQYRDELNEALQNRPVRPAIMELIKWPLYLLAFIHFIPLLLIGKKVLSGVKDHTFHSSIKFGLGMLLQPIFTLILGGIVVVIFHSWWAFWIYLALMPFWGSLFSEFQGRKRSLD